MKFEFATAGRIIFGQGALEQVGNISVSLGQKALVVSGKRTDAADRLAGILGRVGLKSAHFSTAGEPSVEVLRDLINYLAECKCDLVISIGGGSALDAGKAAAAMATQPGELLEYLEVIGRGKALQNQPLPFIAIPTTAGTGSEVTRNAVITSEQHGVKVSMRSPHLLAKAAVIDPELMLGMPPEVTAATGLDALTQLVEPFVSRKANPLSDGFCREGMIRVRRSLKTAYEQGSNLSAREDMALAALLSGLALANAGLGAAHGLAGPLGGMLGAAHGALCARLAGPVAMVNQAAMRDREPGNPGLVRYAEAGRILTGEESNSPAVLPGWIDSLADTMKIPRLGEMGVEPAMFARLAEQASVSSSMQANPINLLPEEILQILEMAY